MMKNNGKLRLYSITNDAAEDTNTTSYGKDGWSLMQHGNLPHVSKMVAKPYSKNINTDSTYKWTCHHAQQGNPDNHLHIPWRRIGRPLYSGPNNSVYSSNSTTASYITLMHHLESIYNIQRCSSIRRNFHCSLILVTTYISDFLTFCLNWYSPCWKVLLKVHLLSILSNKFNVSLHTLTWSTKCYTTLWNQEGTDIFLTLASGNTNLALAVFSCLWESLIVFAKDWLHVWA